MDLAGKKIVVTGAASGIGKESTRVLRKRGATVIGMDRNKPSNGLVDEYIAVDLMDSAAIDAAVASIDGEVHALCSIAGVPPTASVVTVVTVNFIALRYLTEQMLNKLSDGASIVNMASLAGDRLAAASRSRRSDLSPTLTSKMPKCFATKWT